MENYLPSFTAQISSIIPRCRLMYFLLAEVTRFRIPYPDFLNSIVLITPTIGERVFVFPKKRRGKKVSQIIFSSPANKSPVSQVKC